MQRFWYNCPVKFYRIESDFEDVLNPQNIQAFGETKPYMLEKNALHRYLIPHHNNEIFTSDFKLYVVSGFLKKQISCDVRVVDGKVKYVTFICKDSISGFLQLYSGNMLVYQSNCIRFADTSQSDVKYARIVTKHNYNRQLFDFDLPNAYFVTNIPIYENGDYGMDAEISNERIGGISTLLTAETYLDEVVNYELAANGNGDIINFVQSSVTNSEFYLNGTKRTSVDKLDADDNGMFATLKLVNAKDENGFNIVIDESVIFSDLQLSLVALTPEDNSFSTQQNFNANNRISIELNNDFLIDPSKYVKIYRNGSLFVQKSGAQLVKQGNVLIINDTSLNPSDLVLDVASYYVLMDTGLLYTSFGGTFGINDSSFWNWQITSNTQQINFVQWIDGTEAEKVGNQDAATMIIKPGYGFDSSVWQEDLGSGFNDIAGSANQSMIIRSLQNGVTQFRNIAYDSNGVENISNVLRYTKFATPTLKSVVKLSQNSGRFVWNNNGIDYGSGSAVFQVSTDNGLNWTNFQTLGSGSVSSDNSADISSSVLSGLPNNTAAKFRVVNSGNGLTSIPSNTVDVIWQKTSKISIPPLSIVSTPDGNCSYTLLVQDSDFIGFAITRAETVTNVRRVSASFDPYGDSISPSSTTVEKISQVNIPIGTYQCTIMVSSTKNNQNNPSESTASIGYSMTPVFSDSTCSATAINIS